MTFSQTLIDGLVSMVNVHIDRETNAPYFTVWLRCGGPVGTGDTVEEAIADARALNAEWLDAGWIRKAVS